MSFSWTDRRAWFQSLRADPPEVLILGGGVVGCSIAAHTARLGLKTVLFERNDLATGASGNSTGLAHAGLRYLAQGQIGYVFKESRERARIERLAPQWVRPFNFLYPVYKNDPFSLSMVRLGTTIYDGMAWADAALTRRPLPRAHRLADPRELQLRIPGLRGEGLEGATEYFVDARLIDSRFTLGWAQQAARHGARIITYADVIGFHNKADERQKLTCIDRSTGESVSVDVPLVINATGAWIDEIRHAAGFEKSIVTPREGAHLVVDQIATTPLIFSTEMKGRVFFVIPFGRTGSLIGTTDVACRGPIDEVVPSAEEVRDLIRRLFQFFPYLKQGSTLQESVDLFKQVHVRDIYWGVRPLVRRDKPSSDPSRDYALVRDSKSFWSVPGVKLTAARASGADVARAIWKAIRKERMPTVKDEALPGGDILHYDRYVMEAQKRFRIGENSDDIMAYLVARYGSRYAEVMRLVDAEEHYRERILPDEPWIVAEAAYAAQEEMVVTLNDFMWRRTKWAHDRDIPDQALFKIVSAMAEFLDWSPDDVETQMNDYKIERLAHRVAP